MPEVFEAFPHDKEFTEEDIYSEDAVEELLEEDVISPEEEGFMRGYLMSDQGEA